MSDTANTQAKKGLFARLKDWFKGLAKEFRKIIWPAKGDVLKESVAVVIITVFLGIIIKFIDLLVKFGLDKILAI